MKRLINPDDLQSVSSTNFNQSKKNKILISILATCNDLNINILETNKISYRLDNPFIFPKKTKTHTKEKPTNTQTIQSAASEKYSNQTQLRKQNNENSHRNSFTIASTIWNKIRNDEYNNKKKKITTSETKQNDALKKQKGDTSKRNKRAHRMRAKS